jgi:protein involved in temperature-dependent protein secretion
MKSISKMLALTVMLGVLSMRAATATTPPTTVEDQPHMQAALEALKQAKAHLEQAAHDKGGHREAAIKAVNDAIKHTEEGIKYANQHK